MLILNIASLGGDENTKTFIDSEEGSNIVRVALGDKEYKLSTREAMQLSANLLTEASIARGSKVIITAPKFTEEDFLRALYDAEKNFAGTGFVGLNHFMTKWKSVYLHKEKAERQKLLNKLNKRGLVEIYDTDDAKAVRLDKDIFDKFESDNS